jgi:hypothetical protein
MEPFYPSLNGSAEIRVTPFLAVVFGERSLNPVIFAAVPIGGDRDTIDMLDPTLGGSRL